MDDMQNAALTAIIEGGMTNLVDRLLGELDGAFKNMQEMLTAKGETDVVNGAVVGLSIARLMVRNAREQLAGMTSP